MPELPEVESIKRILHTRLKNKKVKSINVLDEGILTRDKNNTAKTVEEFTNAINGKTIKYVIRSAKNLIFLLSNGGAILIHLRMTGQLLLQEKLIRGGKNRYDIKLPDKHTHVVFEFNDARLFYRDIRKFGYISYYNNTSDPVFKKQIKADAVDPLDEDFDKGYFIMVFSHLEGNIKANFLNQRGVVGVGNIYADEICFDAKLRPDRKNKTLTFEELDVLFDSIMRILNAAINKKGSSISDYVLPDGSKGEYAKEHKVYGKGGEKCVICEKILVKKVINTRTTIFCSSCQQ
jgi:formamidopyrimidine-DNA glycosylase